MIKTIKTLGEFYIQGRGKVFTADRREHEFELLDLMKETISINSELYVVRGIESTRGLVPGRFVGLLVRKVGE